MNRIYCILFLLISFESKSFCFEEAGYRYNIESDLIKAIAIVESGLDEKAVNRNIDKNGKVLSVDHGLMQINSWWFRRLKEFNVNEKTIYDPCFNVMIGAYILSSNFSTNGMNWESVGAYNAGFKKLNEKSRLIYINKVKVKYYKIKSKTLQ
ncbi:lytic transglycosylase domain-containing protein [Vibrio sp.]|nr:lytic transglycosylase domain-containing protein [Vibrio sp.]